MSVSMLGLGVPLPSADELAEAAGCPRPPPWMPKKLLWRRAQWRAEHNWDQMICMFLSTHGFVRVEKEVDGEGAPALLCLPVSGSGCRFSLPGGHKEHQDVSTEIKKYKKCALPSEAASTQTSGAYVCPWLEQPTAHSRAPTPRTLKITLA